MTLNVSAHYLTQICGRKRHTDSASMSTAQTDGTWYIVLDMANAVFFI